MARQSIFDMKVSKIYPLLLQKLERKGRSKEELDAMEIFSVMRLP